jgi:hypothetical protein
MLTCYFDESGTASSQVVVLAGYAADARKWLQFEREWKKILLEFHLPYFHMSECAHFRGPFEGWSEAKRKDLLGRLAFTITSKVKWSISCSIPMKDYCSVVPEVMRHRIKNPYYVCIWACFRMIIRCCRADKFFADRINFVFDSRSGALNEALDIFQYQKAAPILSEEEKASFGTLSYDNDRVLTPLQAADFLAYEVSKYRRGWVRRSLQALDCVPGTHVHFDSQRLKPLVDELIVELLERHERRKQNSLSGGPTG